MKKGLLLILIVLLVTGCSKLSSDNMDTTVNGIVTSKIRQTEYLIVTSITCLLV